MSTHHEHNKSELHPLPGANFLRLILLKAIASRQNSNFQYNLAAMGPYSNPEVIPQEFVEAVSPDAYTTRVMVFNDADRAVDAADFAQELGIRPIRYLEPGVDLAVQDEIIAAYLANEVRFLTLTNEFVDPLGIRSELTVPPAIRRIEDGVDPAIDADRRGRLSAPGTYGWLIIAK